MMAKKGIALLCLWLGASCAVFGLEFGIKISGGVGYFNLKDVNRALNSWVEVLKTRAAISPSWTFLGGGIKRFQIGTEVEGELLFPLNRRLAFSLGTGFFYGEVAEKNALVTIQRGVLTFVYAHPAKVSAFPLSISGYYFFPAGEKMSLYVRAGGGLVLAKYVDRDGYKIIPATYISYGTSAQIATCRGSLFEFGLGASYNVEKNIGFFFEADGHASRPRHFQGQLPDGATGKLYFYEEFNPTVNLWQAKMQLLASAPSGPTFQSVREAMLDFNGFSLKIGMVIHF